MSGIPDLPRKAEAESFWDRYHSDPQFRAEVDADHPLFAGAPEIELGPTGREWSMIRLTDIQAAVVFW